MGHAGWAGELELVRPEPGARDPDAAVTWGVGSLIDPASVHRRVLPNGLTVLVRPDHSAPVVAMVTYVKAGYFDESDDMVGISHVLEHMYFKGTARRAVGEIAKATKSAGGYLNAATIYDHTVYYVVAPSTGWVEALDIQADAYANSVIDAAELSRELEVIIQEANRKADNPGAVATETLYELLHDRHRIRRWRIGREDGLRRLTRQDVIAFYRNFYRPAATILAVVGDVEVDRAVREIAARYGGDSDGPSARSPGPVEVAAPGFRYRELSGDITQSQIAFGWRTVPTLHADTPALDLLATVLGTGRASRLYRAVRERRLASSISVSHYTPSELGVFLVRGEGQPDTAADAARGAWREILGVSQYGVAEIEVERAQRIIEARLIRRLEDMEGQANYLAEWEATGGWRLGDTYQERMMSLTSDDLAGVARRYLDPEQASVLVYRPRAAPAVASDGAAMQTLLGSVGTEQAATLPRAPLAPRVARGSATFEREEGGVRVYRTAGGVPVLVLRKSGSPMVHAGVFALGGASEESERQAGLTSLMVRTAIKGTTSRTGAEIAESGELLGGSVNASAGGESFGWSISVPATRFAQAVELLADIAQHATIPEPAFETERATAIAEAAAERDDMFRYPIQLATRAAFHGHPYGVPTGGTEDSLREITVGAVRAWHGERTLSGASVIAIVGDGDSDTLASAAETAFSELRYEPPRLQSAPSWPRSAVTAAETRDKTQTALVVLFPGPSRTADDRFTARLLASVASGLGGRFFDELRDKQSLAYAVHAFGAERRLAGMVGAYIATSPDKEARARDGLLAEFARFREAPPTEEELERARTYALGAHAIRQQRGAAVLGDMIDAWLNGRLAELSEFESRVAGVTRESMLALARRFFDPGLHVEGIVRGIGKPV